MNNSRNINYNTIKLSLPKTQIDDLLYITSVNPHMLEASPMDDMHQEQYMGLIRARDILKKPGKHEYKNKNINVGNLDSFLKKAEEYGIYFRITSGERKGAKTSSGNRSRHDGGSAIDVTPINGETYEELYEKIKNSPLLDYMVENNIGFLEERNSKDQKKYGATASCIHISVPDTARPFGEKNAIESRKKLLGA